MTRRVRRSGALVLLAFALSFAACAGAHPPGVYNMRFARVGARPPAPHNLADPQVQTRAATTDAIP